MSAESPIAQTFSRFETCKNSLVTILPFFKGNPDFFIIFETVEPIVEIIVLVSIDLPLLKKTL